MILDVNIFVVNMFLWTVEKALCLSRDQAIPLAQSLSIYFIFPNCLFTSQGSNTTLGEALQVQCFFISLSPNFTLLHKGRQNWNITLVKHFPVFLGFYASQKSFFSPTTNFLSASIENYPYFKLRMFYSNAV